MTDSEIHGIAEDAAHLLDALKEQEFNVQDCMAIVVAAMPAIVARSAGTS
jgi:hypothetical protein